MNWNITWALWWTLLVPTISTKVTSPQDLKCLAHVLTYVSEVQKGTSWALQMLDATTKLPDGLLYGNINQLGNFDECIATRAQSANTTLFRGRYCRAALSVSVPSSSNKTVALSWLLQRAEKSRPTNEDAAPGALSLPPIMWGLCMPSSCSAADISNLLQQFLPGILESVLQLRVNVSSSIDPTECHAEGEGKSGLDSGSWVFLGFLVLMAVVVVTSTALDCAQVNWASHPLLLAFSARATSKQLFSTRPEPGMLGCLHGLRVFSILYVILGHSYGVHMSGPISNKIIRYEMMSEVISMTIQNSHLAVDTFFFLSGLLVSYGYFKEMQKALHFDAYKFYLYRYMRLAIPMVVIITFYMTLMSYMGFGPMWNFYIGYEKNACDKNWWINMLYVNNYLDILNGCLVQTWYLAVDMQLAWFSPLILLCINHSPRAGLQMTYLLIAVSCFLPFSLIYINNFIWSPNVIAQDASFVASINFNTPCRAAPYLVGILLGYQLFHSRTKTSTLSRLWVMAGWCFSTAVCLTVMFSFSIAYQPDYVYNNLETAFYGGFHRFGWSLGLAWIVFACVKGHGGPVDKILSWGALQPLSRLSYAAYLTHFIVLLYGSGVQRSTKYLGHFDAIYSFLGSLPLIFAVSLILYVLFEAPVLAILRYAFKKEKSSKKAFSTSKANN